jgi:hypothetical protein
MDNEPLLSIPDERSITIHGSSNRKSALITFSDDDVIIHVEGKPTLNLSYHQIRSWSTGENSWALQYFDSSHQLHIFKFIPYPPTTPKYCTRIVREFAIDILYRDKNL